MFYSLKSNKRWQSVLLGSLQTAAYIEVTYAVEGIKKGNDPRPTTH
jgi:hypothetical protein